ncbi:phosphomevalonate kinase [Lentibacillus sp. N15]|uniref:phosphomevalonate kinase n=1 Tax=Lentibacillus songyuanensis TaxID=3136161 RepID=UPI0031BBCAD4
MSNRSITIQAPGKLMVAGEFAVLEPYHQLVVMAVNRYVYATISAQGENRLSLMDFGLTDLEWEYNPSKCHVHSSDERIRFVKDAMTVVLSYLSENGIPLNNFHLSIKSELDDSSGKKYGLGSSAAVVTSVVAAILHQHLPTKPTKELIFKLAAIAHVKTQGSGSGADVAASSYGGFLLYRSFQADWLLEQYTLARSITGLVQQDWLYCSVQPIELPDNVHICIGWTGSPASTSKLIPRIRQLNEDHPKCYGQFLQTSEQAVSSFMKGMVAGDVDLLCRGIVDNRHALATVGEHAGVAVETPLLKTLCDLAEKYGGVGKPSGAGGGDCGIAFMPNQEKANQLMKAWQDAGIKPLTIVPYPYGAKIIE